VRLGGFTDPITLTVEGLPPGVSVSSTTIPANQLTAEIVFKAEKQASIRASRLTIRGTAKVGSRKAVLPAPLGQADLDSVLLAVTVPTPFKVVGVYNMQWVARGTVLKRRYQLERRGFDGPVTVSLADRQMRHLQGVTGPTITVPAGATEFEYAVQLSPWMETGRTCRACLMAVGIVKDADGAEHTVSFHSVQQNDQMVAVVEPGKLDVTADRHSLLATPGTSVAVPLRVARGKGLEGPVTVELIAAPHVRGVSADALTIRAGRDNGTLMIRFADRLRGPLGAPLVIRATLLDRGKPVLAETKLELQP
jgi:hypothetical protein